MLECIINIVPFGERSLTREINKIQIINDGTGSNEIGNYIIRYVINNKKFEKKIKNFDRSKGALNLYLEALSMITKEE